VETEPKVNPRTGSEIVFTSGRSGAAQIYRMNLDGTGLTRITTGGGEAGNPAWSPQGDRIAFSWKQTYGTGFQIFVYNTETRKLTQLTQGGRRNENPTWAPDGRHIAFSSARSGSTQIWTMLADGSRQRQLTFEHRNENPVWSH
jgi:TolB protein